MPIYYLVAILTERPYKNISIKTEFAETIEAFINENPQLGYRSIAAFLEDASRRRLEDLKALQKAYSRFEHFNMGMDGVRIVDRKLKRIADVYFKPEGIWCGLDNKSDCEHIDFALSVPEIQGIIERRRKEDWKLPEV
jgi:hypothetical protein